MQQYFGEFLEAVAKKRKAAEERNKIHKPIGDVPYHEVVDYSKKELANGTPLKYIVDTIHYQTKQHNETKGRI